MGTKKLVNDFSHYLPLLGIFLTGFVGVILFPYDTIFRVIIIFSLGVAYFFWGLIHHKLHKDLSLYVVFEYFWIALIGVVLITAVTLR